MIDDFALPGRTCQRQEAHFPRYGKPEHRPRCPLLRADMAKSV